MKLWNLVIFILFAIMILLLALHFFTGESWEPIVAAIISVQAAIWKEISEIKSDLKDINSKL